MTAMDAWDVDTLFATVRRAAPFASLPRSAFESVLDMLAGRYPSDEFAELRPRLTWDRLKSTVTARESAKRVAVINGGTIPDRGLYGVFLAGGADSGAARVGELDEEMVFESRVGETFLLGASSWRIEEITHDRVTVSPAPGQPGQDAFLEGRGPGTADRVRPGHRCARANTRRHACRCGDGTADPAPWARSARRREPAPVPRRSEDRHPRVTRRSDDRDRALPRRARRLARVPPVAVRRPRPHAVGDGGSGAHPGAPGHRRRDHVDRRRVRRAVPGNRRSAGREPAAAARGGDRRTRPAPVGGDRPVRRDVPRMRGACAAAAAAARRAAHPAVAAAQEGPRPAAGGLAIRVVPDAARVLSRVPARPLRHAGPHGRAARDRAAHDPGRHGRHDDLRRPSRPRCCSATSPTTCTTATRRWRSDGRRRSRSTRTSCASCSATQNCGRCSTRMWSTRSSANCSWSAGVERRARTASTTCSCVSETSPRPNWPRGARTAPARRGPTRSWRPAGRVAADHG